MCGRYTLTTSAKALAAAFWLDDEPQIVPRHNIAPSQPVGVIVQEPESGPLRFAMMRWGLIPHWARDPSIGNRLINARSEQITTKPAFRAAIRYRRCLVAADGFYEWKRTDGGKQPYRITMMDRSVFALAGLWESWQDPGGAQIDSCAILTTRPNDLVADIHDRMPVILDRADYRRWLDRQMTDPGQVVELLGPFAAKPMEAYPVGRIVNNPRNETPLCIERLPA